MKKIFILLLFIVVAVACKAQTTTVYSLQNHDFGLNLFPGVYVKDTYNDFNKFEGVWKYENANKKFIIQLRKKTHFLHDIEYIYIDLLAGEYQFFLNNVEIANTMANLTNDSSVYCNNIIGHTFLRNSNYPSCAECGPTERRVELDFKDPDSRPSAEGYIVLRYINENGIEKIQATIYYSIPLVHDGETFVPPRVPKGTYVFVKQ